MKRGWSRFFGLRPQNDEERMLLRMTVFVILSPEGAKDLKA